MGNQWQHWVRLPSSLHGPQHEFKIQVDLEAQYSCLESPAQGCGAHGPAPGPVWVEPCVSGKIRVLASMRSWAVTAWSGGTVLSSQLTGPGAKPFCQLTENSRDYLLEAVRMDGSLNNLVLLVEVSISNAPWSPPFHRDMFQDLFRIPETTGTTEPCMYYVLFYTCYLWWSLIYKLVIVKDEQQW